MYKVNCFLASAIYLIFTALSAQAALKTYTEKERFLTETGAVDVIGDYPPINNVPPKKTLVFTGGVETLTVKAEDIFTGEATDLLPGLELRVSYGTPKSERLSESIDVELDGERYAFGFDLVEPSGGIDSIFQVTLYLSSEYVGHFTFAPPDDLAAFAGVWSELPFNRIEIREVKGSNENEHYGHFHTGKNAPQSFSPFFTGKPAKLLADDGEARDVFGASVALDENTALIGAQFSDDIGIDAGAAYIFAYQGGRWVQQAKLLASDGQPDDLFGISLSLDGDTALIGAPTTTNGAPDNRTGATYVFERQGHRWVQTAKLSADDGMQGDTFGRSVALDGDTALIGAPGNGTGAAYIFERQGGNWIQREKLTDTGSQIPSNGFGQSVALDGGTSLIGATNAAHVFFRQGSTWTLQTTLLPYQTGLYSARSVALDGEDTALIGAYGTAYVFVRMGGVWHQQAALMAGNGEVVNNFGGSVALDGDKALIGASRADDKAQSAGAVFVFARQGTTWYQQQPRLLADDGKAEDSFGFSLALQGTKAIIGAPLVNDRAESAGAVYLFGNFGHGGLSIILKAAIQSATRKGEEIRAREALEK